LVKDNAGQGHNEWGSIASDSQRVGDTCLVGINGGFEGPGSVDTVGAGGAETACGDLTPIPSNRAATPRTRDPLMEYGTGWGNNEGGNTQWWGRSGHCQGQRTVDVFHMRVVRRVVLAGTQANKDVPGDDQQPKG